MRLANSSLGISLSLLPASSLDAQLLMTISFCVSVYCSVLDILFVLPVAAQVFSALASRTSALGNFPGVFASLLAFPSCAPLTRTFSLVSSRAEVLSTPFLVFPPLLVSPVSAQFFSALVSRTSVLGNFPGVFASLSAFLSCAPSTRSFSLVSDRAEVSSTPFLKTPLRWAFVVPEAVHACSSKS
jgi:hypothetical protein